MADTPTTRAGLQAQFPDNTTAQIFPQNARNFIVTILGPEFVITPVSGAVTWALATTPIATVTLTANTVITVTGGEAGFTGYRLAIIQGSGGNFVPTLSGVTLAPGSTVPSWQTAAGAINRVYIDCVGSTLMTDII